MYDSLYLEVLAGLRSLGYHGALLAESYRFADWFARDMEEREVPAVAFGQTPVSYETACIGVVRANGYRNEAIVNRFRALGAPVMLEIDNSEIREWAVSRKENGHILVERYPQEAIMQMFVARAADWRPEPLLRAKNIGSFRWIQQLSLFAGVLPELEERIQQKLDPLLRETLSITKDVYRSSAGHQPDATKLFKLVFWILTAKVFHDRAVPGFKAIGADSDQLLNAVAIHYKTEVPRLLNRDARQAATERIWNAFDFRNLSVEVLSQIWSTTLVDEDTKRRLGIHRTSRTIIRYMLERIPFEHTGDDRRIIFEPCCGSAVFLVGAMNILRQKLFGATPSERHKYFTQHLAGIEKDPFGVEISRLALTLADFPNPDGWHISQQDAFEPLVLAKYLRRAGVVLCNPPFGDFNTAERDKYKPSSVKKPAELLGRVLDDLHPSGVIGFVLPRNVIDGRGYAPIRKRLAERFATIELTLLPDRAFEADSEIGLLIATEPIPHNACRITNRKVNDSAEAWQKFELQHEVSTDHAVELTADETVRGFSVSELPEIWDFLVNYPTLDEVAELHRGIEWNRPLTKDGAETGNRFALVRQEPANGYMLGIAPKTRFNVFEKPHMAYLSLRPADQRGNAYKRPWNRRKAILNKAARDRGRWRIAAFPDSEGVSCYQTYIGVWPKSDLYNEWILSAILNSPVANAFVATREGKTDITVETLKLIPVPHFTESQRRRLEWLIKIYQQSVSELTVDSSDQANALKEIDALVLDGYRMPPKLERKLLDFFSGQSRATPYDFGDYIPAQCEVYFSLSEYLTPEFRAATSRELLKRMSAD